MARRSVCRSVGGVVPTPAVLSRYGSIGALRREANGGSFIRLTTPQQKFRDDPSPVAIWRDGNQLGKSTALAAIVVDFIRGRVPWRRKRGPVTVVVIGVSHEQMYPLHDKIWKALPKDEIESLGFEPGRGIRGKPPRVSFTSGPGAGSLILFRTYQQSTQILAGLTASLVICDEPCPERVYGEILPRLMRHRGHLRIGFTPTPDAPPLGWLREKIDAGAVSEHNYGLAAANCWPAGAPAPWISQGEIEQYAASLLPVERKMRMFGDWEPVTEGAWLGNFVDGQHVAPLDVSDLHGWKLAVGIDHGTAPNKEAAILCAYTDETTGRPRIAFLDELNWRGEITPEIVARDILDMLGRHGLQYSDVDLWVGDRATGENKRHVRISNSEIRSELAYAMGVAYRKTAYIKTPKKSRGSVLAGLRMMNNLMGAERSTDGVAHLRISPRCKVLIEAFRRFRGDRRDPLKDVLDAARYVAETAFRRPTAAFAARY